MKAKDIKALEHLPAVIRALKALAEEQSEFNTLMTKTGVAPRPQPPQENWAQAGMRLAETTISYVPPTPHTPNDAALELKRQREKAERLRWLEENRAVKESKMKQFAKQPGEEIVETVVETEIETMSGSEANG